MGYTCYNYQAVHPPLLYPSFSPATIHSIRLRCHGPLRSILDRSFLRDGVVLCPSPKALVRRYSRHLREQQRLLLGLRNVRSHPRRHRNPTADASPVEFANACGQKDRLSCHLCRRLHVCLPKAGQSYPLLLPADQSDCSIIAITAVRIKFMNSLELSDPTYNLAQIGIFSAIVPLLGIANANLPVMPPAFKKMFKSTMLDTKHPSKDTGNSSSLHSSNWNRRGDAHGRGKGGEFERLDEPEIPLTYVSQSSRTSD